MSSNKVAKNAAWIVGTHIVRSLLALVISALVARYLGSSQFGVITYATSLVTFITPLMKLGFGNILVREIVNNPEREGKVLGTAIFFNIASSILCIIGVTAFAFVANPGEPETVIVCGLFSLQLLFQAAEMLHYWYQAKYMSKYTSIISLIAYFVVTGYKVFLLATNKSVYWFAVVNALDYAIIALGIYIVYRFKKTQKLQISFAVGKEMFKSSKHYILSEMMITVFTQTDKIMLKAMIDSSATGFYGAATTWAVMAQFVFAAILDSFRPWILEGKKESEEIFKHRMKMLYSLITYLALLQCVVLTVFAHLIIHIAYGDQYMPAAGTLMILVWYTLFSFLGSARNIWVLANEKQKYLWIINLSGALANVVLNLILIPICSVYGAAIASLVTQFVANIVVCLILKPYRPSIQLMAEALNPKYCIDAAKKLLKREKKTDAKA